MMYSKIAVLAALLVGASAAPISLPFTITDSSNSFSKTIKAPLARVVSFVQDPQTMIHLNPVVKKVVPDVASPKTKFAIDDNLDILGIPFSTHYTADFTLGDKTGAAPVMVVNSDAGLGTKLENTWTVKAVDADTTVVTEQVTVSASALVMPIIKGTLGSAHNEMLDNLAKLVEGSGAAPQPI